MNNGYFGKFYKTPAVIYRRVLNDDYYSSGELQRVKAILCDFQDMYDVTRSEKYGIRDEKKARIFFDTDTNISVDQYAVIDGVTYLITGIEHRELGSMAILKRQVGA